MEGSANTEQTPFVEAPARMLVTAPIEEVLFFASSTDARFQPGGERQFVNRPMVLSILRRLGDNPDQDDREVAISQLRQLFVPNLLMDEGTSVGEISKERRSTPRIGGVVFTYDQEMLKTAMSNKLEFAISLPEVDPETKRIRPEWEVRIMHTPRLNDPENIQEVIREYLEKLTLNTELTDWFTLTDVDEVSGTRRITFNIPELLE